MKGRTVVGLFCSKCHRRKPWDKLRPSYSFHKTRQITERYWFCRDCGELVKVETVPNEDQSKTS